MYRMPLQNRLADLLERNNTENDGLENFASNRVNYKCTFFIKGLIKTAKLIDPRPAAMNKKRKNVSAGLNEASYPVETTEDRR